MYNQNILQTFHIVLYSKDYLNNFFIRLVLLSVFLKLTIKVNYFFSLYFIINN